MTAPSARTPEIVARFKEAQDRLVLQSADMSLETVAAMVDDEAIDIRPDYQRRERWDSGRQSSLIESFLLNIPVPPVYLSEEDYGIYSVIDGKQRITAIHQFMRNELSLNRTDTFEQVHGRRFKELPAELRNALTVRPYLRVVTLLKQSAPDLKYEVFTRLNRGGQPLNAQEIRNVVFRGPLNDLIVELSIHPFLKQQLKIRSHKSSAYKDMADAEFVLRFFTVASTWKSFSGDYRWSMDQFMKKHHDADEETLPKHRGKFLRSIEACKNIWGAHAFKRPAGSGWRDQMLAGMYDAQMVAINECSDSAVQHAVQHRRRVITLTRKAFDDPDFDAAVRQATNTPARMKSRIDTMRGIIVGT